MPVISGSAPTLLRGLLTLLSLGVVSFATMLFISARAPRALETPEGLGTDILEPRAPASSFRGLLKEIRRPLPSDTAESHPCEPGPEYSALDTAIDESTIESWTEPVVGGSRSISVGPTSGAVDSSSAWIWARLDGAHRARVHHGTDASLRTGVLLTDWASAEPDSDYTLRWQLEDLLPDTRYYYAVVVEGEDLEPDRIRTFRTAPPEDSSAEFSFVAFADASAENPARAYVRAADHDPAFAVQIGDLDHRDPAETWRMDIEGWRQMHREVLRDSVSGEQFDESILSSMPLFHTWDDHDFGDNDSSRISFFRSVARKAFREYFPSPEYPNPAAGNWYSWRWAQVEFFMLDLRFQRDPGWFCDGPRHSALAGVAIENDQKAWLKSGLLSSTAAWKVVFSSSSWNPSEERPDSWSMYATEQAELVDFIRDNDIDGVMIVSADIHSGGAIDDGTFSLLPELSVPTTNTGGYACTGGDTCGSWSEGIVDPSITPMAIGYALLSFSYSEETDLHTALLQTRDIEGAVTVEYRMER